MTVRGIRVRTGALVVAGGLLAGTMLAGCSNHSGLRRMHPSDGAATASDLPSGFAGSSPASAIRTPSSSTSPGRTPARSSSAGAAASSSPGAPPSGAGGHPSSSSHRPQPSGSSSRTRGSSVPPPPPPSPSVAVSPGSGLRGGQQVTVSGAHFGQGEELGVQECRTSLSTCFTITGRSATADGGGAFRTSLVVSSTVGLSSCHANGCVIRVRRADGDVFVVPIAFG